ncbi:hypothetical protein GCM10023190_07620 [Enteractinococcus fodinae]
MWFCLAAGLGAVLRYVADIYLPRSGILVVNIAGSFLAGAVLGFDYFVNVDPTVVLIVLGGFAGSVTTYATVALAAAEQRIQSTRKVARTWLLQVGLSSLACCFGLLGSIVLLG